MVNLVMVSGKRKRAIAKVKLKEGKGRVLYNGMPYESLSNLHMLALAEPIRIAENVLGKFNFDIEIRTNGGGKEGQIQAARLGIAKAIIKFTNDMKLREEYINYDRHLLVADTRRKEAYKPDDSKARAKRQSSKR